MRGAGRVGNVVKSHRIDGDLTSVFQVELPGGGVFSTEPIPSPPFDETLAITTLGACTLLAVYVDGDNVMRAAVFDDTGYPLAPPLVLGGPRWRPTLATTSDGAYLAWWEPADVPEGAVGWDPVLEELWLQRLDWDGSVLDVSQEPIPLPRDDHHRLGDQGTPALVSLPYWPTCALLAAWTDWSGGNYGGQASHADVVVELIPTPVVRTMGGM